MSIRILFLWLHDMHCWMGNTCVPTFNTFMISAEMIGFKNMDPRYNAQYQIPSIQFFTNNSKVDSISNIQRGQYINTGVVNYFGLPVKFYQPVPLDSYVYFSFLSYFMAFIGIFLLQSFTIFIIDIFCTKTIPSTVTLWERFLHAIQKSHLPFPFQNWHEGNGSCLDHMERKKLGQKEVLTATIVNLAFNMVMLIPLVILCKIKNVLHYENKFTKTFRPTDIWHIFTKF